MEKGQCLQQIVLGKLDIYMEKNEIKSLSYATHKNQLKIKDFNIRSKTICLEENIGEKLHIGLSTDFLDIPKEQAINEKTDKKDYIQLKAHAQQRKQQNQKVTYGKEENWQTIYLIRG